MQLIAENGQVDTITLVREGSHSLYSGNSICIRSAEPAILSKKKMWQALKPKITISEAMPTVRIY
jgi:hypothetical protein